MPVVVKGHAEPLAVSGLVGRPVGTGMIEFGSLVGRHAELARLTHLMEGVVSGPGGVVLIEGEPGVGKSHLVDEARRRLLARHDVTWLAVSTDEARPGTLAPFLPVLRDLFYLDLAGDDGGRRSLFDLGVDQRVKELQVVDSPDAQVTASSVNHLRSYLAALVGVRWEGSAFEEHEPSTRLERCLEAIANYLHSESLLRPLVVHVRDAHELDVESVRLVELLASAGEYGRLCLVLDRRHDPTTLPVTPDRTITVEPMDRRGVDAMIEGLLGTSATPELGEHIHHRTAGNALFVEQLVVDLERRGCLVRDPVGRWTLADFAATELPVTLNAALLSRLDHLDPAVSQIVQAASVLGEVFERDVLSAMEVVAADQLELLLVAAGAEGVWSSVDGQRYRFRHALLRDAAYGMQLDDHLRTQHRIAARALVRCRGRRGTAPEVARHLRMAGTHLLAAGLFRRAAEEAVEASRLREAVRHYEAALEQAELAGCGSIVRTGLHQGAAVAAAALGDHAVALDHLDGVLGGAHLAAADEATSRILKGEVLHRLGRPRQSAVEYEAALVTLQDAPDVLCASRIYAGLAMVHGQLGELDEALDLAEMALILAQGDDEGEARAHQRIAQIQWCRNKHQESVLHGLAALEHYPRIDDRRARAAVHNNLGLAYASLERRDEAMVEFKVAVDDFERTGSEHGLACALDNLAQQYARTGANDEAMVHLERAVAILARIGMGPDGVVAAMWQGGCW